MAGEIFTLEDEFKRISQPDLSSELAQERVAEKRAAEAQAFHAAAYREMPEDLRSRAKEWGVSSLIEAVWMNAWENGYKQAVRDATQGDAHDRPVQRAGRTADALATALSDAYEAGR